MKSHRGARDQLLLMDPLIRALVVFLAGTAGINCRASEDPTEPSAATVFVVRLAKQATFAYDLWSLDRFGNQISSSRLARTWYVAEDSVAALGFDDVTVVIDSIQGTAQDTLYFRFSQTGDIYQFGFLSRMIARREGEIIPARWDRIAGFSLGLKATWIVGSADSTGGVTALGELQGEQLYFEVMLDGVRTAVPAYRVDITRGNLFASLWIAPSPSAFLRLREDLFGAATSVAGQLSQLLEIRTPGR